MIQRLAASILAIALINAGAFGKDRKSIPVAPLPSPMLFGKTAFISNGGGEQLAYDSFYAAMKEWGRYEILDSPEKADLIFEISYGVADKGTHVWSVRNPSTGSTQVYSAEMIDPEIHLSVFDGKTHTLLWSALEHRELARREKNREKNMIKAAEAIVTDLTTREKSSY
jgi:hypothetical protein